MTGVRAPGAGSKTGPAFIGPEATRAGGPERKAPRPYAAAALALCLCAAGLFGCMARPAESLTAAMSTFVSQSAYGPGAAEALRQVNSALTSFEEQFSLFSQSGDVARINAGAGSWVRVAPETVALLRQARALSAQSEGAFALTVAPLTLAWGVTGDAPRVPGEEELAALIPLVDDTALQVEEARVRLKNPGMALDLGGIAKGAFCALAARIYGENGVESAWLSVGGNVYARGVKPGGGFYRAGFANPERARAAGQAGTEGAYVASFTLQDEVAAVSGGYERYFEENGERYIHILDPRTGRPAESDILSVGVIDKDGAAADFWSTTLFIWGRERALQQMRAGTKALVLDNAGVLYVSESLRAGFELHDKSLRVEYV